VRSFFFTLYLRYPIRAQIPGDFVELFEGGLNLVDDFLSENMGNF